MQIVPTYRRDATYRLVAYTKNLASNVYDQFWKLDDLLQKYTGCR